MGSCSFLLLLLYITAICSIRCVLGSPICSHEADVFIENLRFQFVISNPPSRVHGLFNKLDVLDIDKVATSITGLQNEDGSFSGDMWGEVDTRFSYITICCLSILCCMDKINVEKAVSYILSCKNLDGGFGCTPGGESRAGQSLGSSQNCSSCISFNTLFYLQCSRGLQDKIMRKHLTKGIEVSWGYLHRNKRSTGFLGIEVAVSKCISFYVVQHQYQCPSS